MKNETIIALYKEFCHVASGDWPSIYNPQRENLFEQEEVVGGIFKDSKAYQSHSISG